MQFLADVELPCEECNGTRYKASTLEVRYKGKNISEVLQLSVKEALRFFAGHPRILDKLAVLDEVGSRLCAAGAVRHDAFGRRSTAGEVGQSPGQRPHDKWQDWPVAHALHSG